MQMISRGEVTQIIREALLHEQVDISGETFPGSVRGSTFKVVSTSASPDTIGEIEMEVESFPTNPDVEGNRFTLAQVAASRGEDHPLYRRVRDRVVSATGGSPRARGGVERVSPPEGEEGVTPAGEATQISQAEAQEIFNVAKTIVNIAQTAHNGLLVSLVAPYRTGANNRSFERDSAAWKINHGMMTLAGAWSNLPGSGMTASSIEAEFSRVIRGMLDAIRELTESGSEQERQAFQVLSAIRQQAANLIPLLADKNASSIAGADWDWFVNWHSSGTSGIDPRALSMQHTRQGRTTTAEVDAKEKYQEFIRQIKSGRTGFSRMLRSPRPKYAGISADIRAALDEIMRLMFQGYVRESGLGDVQDSIGENVDRIHTKLEDFLDTEAPPSVKARKAEMMSGLMEATGQIMDIYSDLSRATTEDSTPSRRQRLVNYIAGLQSDSGLAAIRSLAPLSRGVA